MENRTVLIVDDDEAILQLFELVGNRYGVQTVFATNGSDALTKFERQTFRLVITDLRMPKMNGDEFIRRVRQMPKLKNFPFVVITANLKEFDSKVALLDKVHIIEKPIKLGSIDRIYANIFGQKDQKASSEIPRIVEESKDKIAVLLEVLTKEKPKAEITNQPFTMPNHSATFIVTHPLITKDCHSSLVYFFEKSLAQKITSSISPSYKGEVGQIQIVLESLKRIISSISKKIQDAIDKDFDSHLIPELITAIGTDDINPKALLSKEGPIHTIHFTTQAGQLTLCISIATQPKAET